MNNLDFIRKLYNGRSCYADHMSPEEIELLHIASPLEAFIQTLIRDGKIVFLTGNPGDGKTFIIKALIDTLTEEKAFVETDINSVTDTNYDPLIQHIIKCYREKCACIIAVNEYPFLKLCKRIKELDLELYQEIIAVKKNSIVYDIPEYHADRVFIIDLNERSLLDRDRAMLSKLIQRISELLSDNRGVNSSLDYNLLAINNPFVEEQILSLFGLIAISGEHFAVRDILGTISYMLTACISEAEADTPLKYYDALFSGANELMDYIKQFDPIFLSIPSLDERLWNGEQTDGWQLGAPPKWPCDFEEDVYEAVTCFQSIKRKFYFENIYSKALAEIQPDELQQCSQIFRDIDSNKRRIKEDIILSINKLFLPTDNEKKNLRIWTTHNYDLSREITSAISSRSVSAGDLEIFVPRPADWLEALEYTPAKVLLRPRDKQQPLLQLDYDFLMILSKIKMGYPVGLISSKYELIAAAFLRQLDELGLSEEYEDGEIMIADRSKDYKKSIYIEQNKYSLSKEEE